jgi:hypothetical protein
MQKFGIGTSNKELIADAVAYAHKSAPEALKRLNPPDAVLASIAKAKIPEAEQALTGNTVKVDNGPTKL